tara:strand:+ start:1502 stop:2503 length:1002 start_codon:yes stop_codon:yes gene_type:complete
MDPVSQAVVGGAFASVAASRKRLLAASILGCISAMVPDLDILIKSTTDPLLAIEFHRHFTHALIFIPFGGLIVTTILFPILRYFFNFKTAYGISTIGYGTHGLLDACTSYGTVLLWPFSDARIAWNIISIIDPVFTLTIVGFIVLIMITKKKLFCLLCTAWILGYLVLGLYQHERALKKITLLAAQRNHLPNKIIVKPSIGNLVLWKSVYSYNDYFYIDAIRVFDSSLVCPGEKILKFNLEKHIPKLDKSSQQALDIERFRWFSSDHVGFIASSRYIIDVRYSVIPNTTDPLWGIGVDVNKGREQHVKWITTRNAKSRDFRQLINLIKGRGCF